MFEGHWQIDLKHSENGSMELVGGGDQGKDDVLGHSPCPLRGVEQKAPDQPVVLCLKAEDDLVAQSGVDVPGLNPFSVVHELLTLLPSMVAVFVTQPLDSSNAWFLV